MSENCNHDCGSCSSNCDSREQAQDMTKKLREGSSVKKVIGVVSGKGGVGKSMVTSLLALASNNMDKHTAILDADITGPSIPKAFGLRDNAVSDGESLWPVTTADGIEVMSMNLLLPNDTDPVLWRGPIIAGAVGQFWTDVNWKEIDVMLVDMPPGTGDVPMTVYQSLPIDGIIVVTTPQDLVSMIVEKAVKMAETMDVPVLGLVQNMSYYECDECHNKNYIFGKNDVNATAKHFGIKHTAELAIEPVFSQLVDSGSVENYAGKNLEILTEMLKEILADAK